MYFSKLLGLVCNLHEKLRREKNSAVLFFFNVCLWGQERVRSCLQLIEVYLMDTCPSVGHKDRSISEPPPPPSPNGVLDAAAVCVSCDTRSENLVTGSTSGGSGSREAEPQNKRVRSSASNI